jgi:glycosyltransferase involved in cell wall biosynthesis
MKANTDAYAGTTPPEAGMNIDRAGLMQAVAPRVSVIVPAYNAVAFLEQALDSALAQQFTGFEIVIVNDGSTDATGEIADCYAARHPQLVRVLHKPNGGLPAARNTAIAAARGELFALLDADDVWYPHHLATAVAAFDEDPSLGMVHANIERIDGRGERIMVCGPRWLDSSDPYASLALRLEHVSCPTVVFRRSCVDVVGAFDLQFTGFGCEDRDLWLRIMERYPVRYLDVVTASYRLHGNNMSGNHLKMTAARLKLLDKMRRSPRGAALARHARAMIESDRSLELFNAGHRRNAMAAQLRALAMQPQSALIWRRAFGMVRRYAALAAARVPAQAG